MINTGANRLERNFLCTHRKFTSLASNWLVEYIMSDWATVEDQSLAHFSRTRTLMGTAEMNATSFLLDATLTPTSHSGC